MTGYPASTGKEVESHNLQSWDQESNLKLHHLNSLGTTSCPQPGRLTGSWRAKTVMPA